MPYKMCDSTAAADVEASLYPTVDVNALERMYYAASISNATYLGSYRDQSADKLVQIVKQKLRDYLPGFSSHVAGIGFVYDSDPLFHLGVLRTDTEMMVIFRKDGEVILSFRGTELTLKEGSFIQDWATDLSFVAVPVSNLYGMPSDDTQSAAELHSGFLRAFNSMVKPEAREGDLVSLMEELRRAAVKENPDFQITKITCVGHSLGGALATLAAYWCKKVGFPQAHVSCYTFGSPRVGNAAFADDFNSVKVVPDCYRAVHNDDIVPTVPFEVMGYKHVGKPVLLCQPGTKAYGLGCDVQAAFRRKASKYIAAEWDRPMQLYFSIADHSMDIGYILAVSRILQDVRQSTGHQPSPGSLVPARIPQSALTRQDRMGYYQPKAYKLLLAMILHYVRFILVQLWEQGRRWQLVALGWPAGQ